MPVARYVVGVDVGTGSVRAGLFTAGGRMLGLGIAPIAMRRYDEHFVEQSSRDIWAAAGRAVRAAVRQAGVRKEEVAGISFDATCSLVALDGEGSPLPVGVDGDPEWNVVVWMDHRAIGQAERINATRHRVLRYVGGRISPEMEPPKLLWIKENLRSTWRRAGAFFDLADFMVWASTGVDVRSLCTVVCKWTYLGHEGRFDAGFFRTIGLEDLLERGLAGSDIRPMGTYVGSLTSRAARHLGLSTSCAVGVGIIDAHAGGLGVLGAAFGSGRPSLARLESALALIGGTSSCHMAVSREPRFIKGVWGPYYSAMVPGAWLTEGGQSATGSLVDYTIRNNSAYPELVRRAETSGRTVYEVLNEIVARMQEKEGVGPELTANLHVLPYHHGNRSPKADPTLRGVVDGLSLDESPEAVARLYYATVQAIAYGTREIIEVMNAKGYSIKRIMACGGGTKNPLWLSEHADITGCEIVLPKEPEAVLLGSAMLGAVAAGIYGNVLEAMAAMSAPGEVIRPRRRHAAYHERKYGVFKRMYREQLAHRRIVSAEG